MAQVWVYRFIAYDVGNDEFRQSARWATRETIEGMKIAHILEHTKTSIDEFYLDKYGMTSRGFEPYPKQ